MINRLPAWRFEQDSAVRLLAKQFGTTDLSGFGCDGLGPALCAAGALIDYCRVTQSGELAHVRALQVEHSSSYVRLDAISRRNLEISETLRGEREPTLLSLLDTCVTSGGSRMLFHMLHHPLRDRVALEQRLDAAEILIGTAGA